MDRQEFLSWANAELAAKLSRPMNKAGSNSVQYAIGVPGLRIAVRANLPPEGRVAVQLLADDFRHTKRWHSIKSALFLHSGATGLQSRFGRKHTLRYLEFSWPVEQTSAYRELQPEVQRALNFFMEAKNAGSLSE